uniref:Nucleoporin NUP42 n=1 Tax=Anopheles dirus TaxID=7168 RepID=A0A182NP24_9DIPT
MVICMYFLNNSCRFGSRCNNEHIDIGSIVKNEVDVTLKGNQWPLSCFGPFKERFCIPNFIDDQSFEEIRMMYLEAKMQNNIPSHQMQLAQMINDAKNKMQCLTTMNRDILNTLVELYNQQESSAKPASAPHNPFSTIGTGSSSTSASSIFGGATSGSAFGSGFGSTASAGASSVAGSIFGGGQSSSQPSGNIFGSVASTTNNIFAKPTHQAPSGNIFGMAQTTQQPSNNVFGGPAVMGGGLFGSVQQPSQTTASLFGGVAATNPSSGGNLFASASSNAFGQSQQQQPTGNTGFSGGGNFFNAAPATGGFGSVATQPQQQHQSSGLFNAVPFGNNAQPPTPFGQFGSSMQAATNPPSQSLFLPAPAAASPFGSSMGAGGFGVQPAQTAVQAFAVSQSATMYSGMETVTAEHLAAFNADQFQLGRIPTVPPPKELCH